MSVRAFRVFYQVGSPLGKRKSGLIPALGVLGRAREDREARDAGPVGDGADFIVNAMGGVLWAEHV
jgi:hypothetical protein